MKISFLELLIPCHFFSNISLQTTAPFYLTRFNKNANHDKNWGC